MIDQLEHHFILFSMIFLLLGFILGKNLKHHDKEIIHTESFFKQQKKQREKTKTPTIQIDDSTHVVAIKTDGLEKKYENIGNSKTTNEDISGSINKLKNLKK